MICYLLQVAPYAMTESISFKQLIPKQFQVIFLFLSYQQRNRWRQGAPKLLVPLHTPAEVVWDKGRSWELAPQLRFPPSWAGTQHLSPASALVGS